MSSDPPVSDADCWKIQENTFTRWCNEHLRNDDMSINNLETDLCDGLKLIALLQVLSGKKIQHNLKPRFRIHKFFNLEIALNFMRDENIRFCGVGTEDILNGNRRIILGFIWLLILKYQISLPLGDAYDNEDGSIRPSEALMKWVVMKLPPDIVISNFDKDWNSGIAIGALVDAVAPGLFPQWRDHDPADGLNNAKLAMKVAEVGLCVPQVITPEEISNPNVDRLSVMTYISYFPKATLSVKTEDPGVLNTLLQQDILIS